MGDASPEQTGTPANPTGEPATPGDDAAGGCATHGVALLLASGALVVVMAVITFGCWLVYRLVG